MHSFTYKGLQQNAKLHCILRRLKVKAWETIWLRTILFDNRSSRTQNRVKAAIWARPSIVFALVTLPISIPFVRVSTSLGEERDRKWHHVWYAARSAWRNARLLEAKFSDGMCREAGPDSYAKGSSWAKGEDPGRAMTNDKPVKNRAGAGAIWQCSAKGNGWQGMVFAGLRRTHPMLFKLCGLPAHWTLHLPAHRRGGRSGKRGKEKGGTRRVNGGN